MFLPWLLSIAGLRVRSSFGRCWESWCWSTIISIYIIADTSSHSPLRKKTKTRDCKDQMAYCVRNKIYSPKARARIASSAFGDNLSRLRLRGLLSKGLPRLLATGQMCLSLWQDHDKNHAKRERKIKIQGSVGNLLYYSMCLLQLFPHSQPHSHPPFQANSPWFLNLNSKLEPIPATMDKSKWLAGHHFLRLEWSHRHGATLQSPCVCVFLKLTNIEV